MVAEGGYDAHARTMRAFKRPKGRENGLAALVICL
jgi:hypothetical protein